MEHRSGDDHNILGGEVVKDIGIEDIEEGLPVERTAPFGTPVVPEVYMMI